MGVGWKQEGSGVGWEALLEQVRNLVQWKFQDSMRVTLAKMCEKRKRLRIYEVVQGLPNIYKALGSMPSIAKKVG